MSQTASALNLCVLLSSGWPAERSAYQGAASDALRVAVQPRAGHGQVGPGGQHQHLGAPHGEHHAVAAAAGQHPDQTSEEPRPWKFSPKHKTTLMIFLKPPSSFFFFSPPLPSSPCLQAWPWLTCLPACSWTSCSAWQTAGTWSAWARCAPSWGPSLRTGFCGRNSASTTSLTDRSVETKSNAGSDPSSRTVKRTKSCIRVPTFRSESVWWCATRVTWSGRRCTSSWAAAILAGSSTATRCISAHTATSSSGRWTHLVFPLGQSDKRGKAVGIKRHECFCFFFAAGHKPPVHGQQPRKLHHVAVASRFYQPFQLLTAPLPAEKWVNCVNTVHKCVK